MHKDSKTEIRALNDVVDLFCKSISRMRAHDIFYFVVTISFLTTPDDPCSNEIKMQFTNTYALNKYAERRRNNIARYLSTKWTKEN